jgi:hypothetical protein
MELIVYLLLLLHKLEVVVDMVDQEQVVEILLHLDLVAAVDLELQVELVVHKVLQEEMVMLEMVLQVVEAVLGKQDKLVSILPLAVSVDMVVMVFKYQQHLEIQYLHQHQLVEE